MSFSTTKKKLNLDEIEDVPRGDDRRDSTDSIGSSNERGGQSTRRTRILSAGSRHRPSSPNATISVHQYMNANLYQRTLAAWALRDYSHYLKWSRNPETVIDLGCKTGDLTREVLRPVCPPDTTIVGVDEVDAMIEFAQEVYSEENVRYELCDIIEDLSKQFGGKDFDKCFSFFCLNWFREPKNVLKQVSLCLADNAQGFFFFTAASPMYDAYRQLSQEPKWAPYMKDVESKICCYHDAPDITNAVTKDFEESGFRVLVCDLVVKFHSFSNLIVFGIAISPQTPWLDQMNPADRNEFISSIGNIVRNRHPHESSIKVETTMAVVVCQKLTVPKETSTNESANGKESHSKAIMDTKAAESTPHGRIVSPKNLNKASTTPAAVHDKVRKSSQSTAAQITVFSDPDLYYQANHEQRSEAAWALQEYGDRLKWSNSKETVLDLGCGTGDVTNQALRPICPEGTRILAVDLSEPMIRFARANHAQSSITYEVCDGMQLTSRYSNKNLDKCFSFFYLNWIRNPPAALKEVNSCLRPHAQIFFVFPTSTVLYDAYRQMAKTPRWAPTMGSDVEDYICAYHDSTDAQKDIALDFTKAGFDIDLCEVKLRPFTFLNVGLMKMTITALNPWVRRMPDIEKDIYIDELTKTLESMMKAKEGTFQGQASLAVVIGKKNAQ